MLPWLEFLSHLVEHSQYHILPLRKVTAPGMSWKMAETKWRDQLGLFESSMDRRWRILRQPSDKQHARENKITQLNDDRIYRNSSQQCHGSPKFDDGEDCNSVSTIVSDVSSIDDSVLGVKYSSSAAAPLVRSSSLMLSPKKEGRYSLACYDTNESIVLLNDSPSSINQIIVRPYDLLGFDDPKSTLPRYDRERAFRGDVQVCEQF